MVSKMKPPTGARIATTLLPEGDFGFMLVGPIVVGRVLGVGGVASAGGAGRGLSAVGESV